MGLITKVVRVKWTASTRDYYENLGYEFTGYFKEFEVDVKDLKSMSSVKLEFECDNEECRRKFERSNRSYLRGKREDGKVYCCECAKNRSAETQRKNKAKSSKTFKQWCIENNRKDVLNRWDYELNELLCAFHFSLFTAFLLTKIVCSNRIVNPKRQGKALKYVTN